MGKIKLTAEQFKQLFGEIEKENMTSEECDCIRSVLDKHRVEISAHDLIMALGRTCTSEDLQVQDDTQRIMLYMYLVIKLSNEFFAGGADEILRIFVEGVTDELC